MSNCLKGFGTVDETNAKIDKCVDNYLNREISTSQFNYEYCCLSEILKEAEAWYIWKIFEELI